MAVTSKDCSYIAKLVKDVTPTPPHVIAANSHIIAPNTAPLTSSTLLLLLTLPSIQCYDDVIEEYNIAKLVVLDRALCWVR